MKLLPEWRTPESVARELIAGLRDGTLTLDGPEPAVLRPPAGPAQMNTDPGVDAAIGAERRPA